MDTIGFDLGTGAIKAIRLDSDGRTVAKLSRRVPFLHPGEKQIEIEPEGYFQLCLAMLRELAAASAVPVSALAFAAASGNTMLCDDAGQPRMNIISWLDTRLDWCPPPAWNVRETTGWPGIPTFPLMHLEYLRQSSPELLKTSQVTMNNEFLTWRLSGQRGLDYSSATPFYLADQRSRKYCQAYLSYYGISEAQLPPLVPTGHKIGTLRPEYCGGALTPETAIVAGSFDHPSGARAVIIRQPGELLVSCGTSWVGFYPAARRDDIPAQELCDPFQSAVGGCWAGMFSVAEVGVKIEEFIRQRYGDAENRYELFNSEAEDESSPAAGLMLEVIGRFKKLLGSRRFRRAVMIGGPSEGASWKKYLTRETGLEVEMSPYGSCTCAAGAALIASGKEF